MMSRWESLPSELFEKIAQLVYQDDELSYYNLTQVSRVWRDLAMRFLYKHMRYGHSRHQHSYMLPHVPIQDKVFWRYLKTRAADTMMFDLASKFKINLSYYTVHSPLNYYKLNFTCFYIEEYGQDFLFMYTDEFHRPIQTKFSHDGHLIYRLYCCDSQHIRYIQLNDKVNYTPKDIDGNIYMSYDGVTPFKPWQYAHLPKPEAPTFQLCKTVVCFYDARKIPKNKDSSVPTMILPKDLPIAHIFTYKEMITFLSLSIDGNYLAVALFGLVRVYKLNPQNYDKSEEIFCKQYPSKVSYLGLTSNAQVLIIRSNRLGGLLMVNLINEDEADIEQYRVDLRMFLQNDHCLIVGGFGESYIYGLPKYNTILQTHQLSANISEKPTKKRQKKKDSRPNATWEYFRKCVDDPILLHYENIWQMENGLSYLSIEDNRIAIHINKSFGKGRKLLSYMDEVLDVDLSSIKLNEVDSLLGLTEFKENQVGVKDGLKKFIRLARDLSDNEQYSSDSDVQILEGNRSSASPSINEEDSDSFSESEDGEDDDDDDDDHGSIEFDRHDSGIDSSTSDSELSEIENNHIHGVPNDEIYHIDIPDGRVHAVMGPYHSSDAESEPGADESSSSDDEDDDFKFCKITIFKFSPVSITPILSVSSSGRRVAVLVNDLLYVLNTTWESIYLLHQLVKHYESCKHLKSLTYPFPIMLRKREKFRVSLAQSVDLVDIDSLNSNWLLKKKIKLKNLDFSMGSELSVKFIDDDRVLIYGNDKCLIYDLDLKSMAPE